MDRVGATVPSSDNAYFVSKFKEETLIPLLGVTRKLSSCNLHHQLKLLPHLARIFQSDEAPFSLMDIIVTGLCQSDVSDEIPVALYDEINSILPSDKELNLKDSVFESRLVEEQDQNEDGQAIKKMKKLPLTLLRIPADLQCHIFHYLHLNELANVQKLCRAMCIAARNPSAIYSVKFNPQLAKTVQFQNEFFSRPKKLMIRPSVVDVRLLANPIIGNEKWGDHVIDLEITKYDRSEDMVFLKLQKCKISLSPTILLNGSISSYHSLKELTLEQIMLTEDMINEIQKLQNLEKLSLIHPSSNPDRLQHSDPISLPKLKLLSYAIPAYGFREFQRFLICSKPETVIEIDAEAFYIDSVPHKGIRIPNMSPIHRCNVVCNNDSSYMFAEAMREWLHVAPSSTFKLFNEINVTIRQESAIFRIDSECISSLIAIFQHANRSKLDIMCSPDKVTDCDVESVVNAIPNAPFGTFTEIKMKMEFNLFQYLVESLEDEWNSEKYPKIIRRIVMESVDDAQKWMEPWLLFNEQRIKAIGLQKLNIEFQCNLKPDYAVIMDDVEWLEVLRTKAVRFEPIINGTIDIILKEVVARWGNNGRQCISVATGKTGYTVKLSL